MVIYTTNLLFQACCIGHEVQNQGHAPFLFEAASMAVFILFCFSCIYFGYLWGLFNPQMTFTQIK